MAFKIFIGIFCKNRQNCVIFAAIDNFLKKVYNNIVLNFGAAL